MTDERKAPEGSRPAPQFGEYAPEGWEWKPETKETTAKSGSGKLTGVPHNLGMGRGSGSPATSSQATQPRAASPAEPAPYRANEPSASRQRGNPAPQQPAPQFTPLGGQQKDRRGDRIMTIVLLAIGAMGALYLAAAVMGMPASFGMMARALDIDGFTIPQALRTTSTVGALAIIALYAVTLLFSIQRLRGHKMAFWVPLAAGVISLVIVFICTMVGMTQSPELMNEMVSNPDSSSRLFDYMSNPDNQ